MIVVARSNAADLGRIKITARSDLRAALTDEATQRIIAEDMLPHFQYLDYYGGLVAGIDHIKLLLGGGRSAAASGRGSPRHRRLRRRSSIATRRSQASSSLPSSCCS